MADPQNVRAAILPAEQSRRSEPRPSAGRRSIGVAAACAFAALIIPAVAQPDLRLVWNVSASVPLGLYRIEPGRDPRVGELAAVRPSPALARLMAERRYVEQGALLVKPVVAVKGARVCRWRNELTIDGARRAAALDRDRFGRDLPRWSGCRTIGANQYFLLAPTIRASFDSRYFGVVAAADVIGRATPMWVWS